MSIKIQSDSENLVETISKFEDQIEDTRFAIASIRIQSAFRTMMKIIDKKIAITSVCFYSRLKHISMKKILNTIEKPISLIFKNLDKLRQRTIMKAFIKIKIKGQRLQGSKLTNKPTNTFYEPSKNAKSEENDQITNREVEQQCTYLKQQIKNIQKSFQDFYNNLNNKK